MCVKQNNLIQNEGQKNALVLVYIYFKYRQRHLNNGATIAYLLCNLGYITPFTWASSTELNDYVRRFLRSLPVLSLFKFEQSDINKRLIHQAGNHSATEQSFLIK